MPSCERCWSDASYTAAMAGVSTSDHYRALIAERGPNGCTPEQQAGPEARVCAGCGRRTVHQHAGVCMACGADTQTAGSPLAAEEG